MSGETGLLRMSSVRDGGELMFRRIARYESLPCWGQVPQLKFALQLLHSEQEETSMSFRNLVCLILLTVFSVSVFSGCKGPDEPKKSGKQKTTGTK